MYYIILLLGFFLAIANILSAFRVNNTAMVGINPIFWLSLFFIFIHILTPAVKYYYSFYRYDLYYDELTLIIVSSLNILVYQIIAYFMNKRVVSTFFRCQKNAPSKNYTYFDNDNKILLIGFLSMLIGIYYMSINLNSHDGTFLQDRIAAGLNRGLSTSLTNFTISSSMLFAYLILKKSSRSNSFKIIVIGLFLISIMSSAYYFQKINSRNSLLIVVVLIVSIFFVLRPAKIQLSYTNLKRILIFAVLCVVFFTTILQFTKLRYEGSTAALIERQEKIILFSLDGAFGNNENLNWLYQNSFETQFGISYLAAVTNFIPRKIWPQKPLGGGPRLKNTIYPGSYVVGAQGNSSLTTGMLTEAYLNFGLLGYIIIPFFWSITAGFLVKKTLYNYGTIKMLKWLTILVLWSTTIMYSEFLGFFVRSVFIATPLIVASFFSSKRKINF